MNETIPIFPLNTVLFPDGLLPLRIFEARYLDMVSECLRTNTGFGICLIQAGQEVGEPAQFHDIGTVARITDWTQESDGLLGITAQGKQRFRVESASVRSNKLIEGVVEYLTEVEQHTVPDEYHSLQDLLAQLADQFELPHDIGTKELNDASCLSFRLAELLPLDIDVKQMLLETDDSLQRLEQLLQLTSEFGLLKQIH